MSLLSQASLVVVPSGYKEDVVYSVKPTDGSGDLTFTRASDGTRVNSQGLVERVPWNLLLQSNTFNTTWTTSNASVTGGQTGYDGSSNAWLIQSSNINGRIDQSISNSGVQTLSVYAKAGNSNWIRLRLDYSGANSDVYFDLQNGVVGSSYNVITTKIEDVGSGWYRCSVVLNQSITVVRIYTTSGNNSAGGSGNSAYIQDAQLVEGSTAKPYFPTTDRLNVPRLDYSAGCPSLLLEPQRTNLVTYSEQFDNVAWTKGNLTISANNTTSPDGTQNAEQFIETTANNIHYVGQGLTASASTYTFSAFLKQGTRQYGGFRAVVNGFTNRYFVLLDLSNGSVVDTETSGTGVTWSHNVESFANGWYRLTITAPHTIGNVDLSISPSDSASPSYFGALPTYTGDTSKNIYAWGAQLEAGSYPTSYIPTTSASVTRVADAASKTGISSLIGQTEGTLFIEMNINKRVNLGGSGPNGLEIKDSSGNNSIIIGTAYSANQVFNLGVRNAGSFSNYLTTTNNALGTYKLAAAYSSAGFVFYINGVQIGTTATLPPSATFADMGLSQVFGTNNPNGELVNQAVIFKTALTNAELASLTTL